MKRALAVSMVILAGAASAGQNKTYGYTCRGGDFTVAAIVDNSKGSDRWSKSEPIILRIAGAPPQTLIADPDAPDADSYRNKDYEFYSLKTFTTLTRKSHGVTVKFYDACRATADVR